MTQDERIGVVVNQSTPTSIVHDENESLRIPQARVLRSLMPAYPEDPPFEWPLLTRAQLGVMSGYTSTSGTVTRALNGIRNVNGASGLEPHLGLIDRLLVEIISVNVEGVIENNYRITHKGIVTLVKYISDGGKLPPVRDAEVCTNDRYAKE